jgi:hypothetical protein
METSSFWKTMPVNTTTGSTVSSTVGTFHSRFFSQKKGPKSPIPLPDDFEWCFAEEGGCDGKLLENVFKLFKADSESGTCLKIMFLNKKDPVSIFPVYRLEPAYEALKEIFKRNNCWLSGFHNKNKELIAFVAATEMTLNVHNESIRCVEVQRSSLWEVKDLRHIP